MATISANALGVYYMPPPDYDDFIISEYDQTKPFSIVQKTASSTFTELTDYGDLVTGQWDNLDYGDYSDWGMYILLNVDGSFAEVVYKYTSSVAFTLTQQPELMSLATSTTLEATNTVNETVARNGANGSTTYIVGGAMSWSMSLDGLLDLSSAGVGTSTGVMDAARSKYYVLVKFDTGTSVNYVGQALIDSVSISGGVDDIATYSASFNGYGDLYKQS